MLYLRKNLDRLRPHLRERVPMRMALHKHPGVHGVVEAAEDILRAVPGVELVDLQQPAIGAMSNYFRALPKLRRELQQNELDAAEAAGIDALVAVYHADHRELCAHEAARPFRIMNMLEIVGASMGLHRDDTYKRLKIMNDVDAIAADCRDLVAEARPRSRDHAGGDQGDARGAAVAGQRPHGIVGYFRISLDELITAWMLRAKSTALGTSMVRARRRNSLALSVAMAGVSMIRLHSASTNVSSSASGTTSVTMPASRARVALIVARGIHQIGEVLARHPVHQRRHHHGRHDAV